MSSSLPDDTQATKQSNVETRNENSALETIQETYLGQHLKKYKEQATKDDTNAAPHTAINKRLDSLLAQEFTRLTFQESLKELDTEARKAARRLVDFLEGKPKFFGEPLLTKRFNSVTSTRMTKTV
jgi:hypothetical protein